MAAPQYITKLETPVGHYIGLRAKNNRQTYTRITEISLFENQEKVKNHDFIIQVYNENPNFKISFKDGNAPLKDIISMDDLIEYKETYESNMVESRARNFYRSLELPKLPSQRIPWLKPKILKPHIEHYLNVGKFLPKGNTSLESDLILRVAMNDKGYLHSFKVKEWRFLEEETTYDDSYLSNIIVKQLKVQALWSEKGKGYEEYDNVVHNKPSGKTNQNKPYFEKPRRERKTQ